MSEPQLPIAHTVANCLLWHVSGAKAVVCNLHEHQAKQGESKCSHKTTLKYGRLIFGSNQHLTSSSLGARYNLKVQLQVADATEKLLKDPQVAGVRDVKLRITTLRRRARVVYLPAYVVDYNFGSRFNAHGERTPERFQAVISGMGELLCSTVL